MGDRSEHVAERSLPEEVEATTPPARTTTRGRHSLTPKQHICTIHAMKHRTGAATPRPATRNRDQPISLALLLETAQSVQRRLETMLEDVELTSAKFLAIDALARAGGPLTLGEFASRLQCVRSNITQLVDRLEADGLVKRVNDPADRRAVLAVLTPLGLKRRAAGARVVTRLEAELSTRVEPAERALLHRLLGALR